jgi:hypothetical protein
MKIIFTVILILLFSCSEAYNDGRKVGKSVCEQWSSPELIKLSDKYLYIDTIGYGKFKQTFLNYLKNNCTEKYIEYKKWIQEKETTLNEVEEKQ